MPVGGRSAVEALGVINELPHRAERLRRMEAVVFAWSQQAPLAARDWVVGELGDDPDARDAGLVAAVRGAVSGVDLSLAERVLAQINAQFPEEARVRTWNFVDALNECGAFADSLAFATRVDSEDRGELTSAIFEAWAAVSPEQAVRTALALSTKRERDHALQAVVATWAAGRPEAAVAFAAGVADGAVREAILSEALPHWFLRDPAGASAWLGRQTPRAELDAGAAAIGAFAPLAKHRPDVAMEWAESIVEHSLRARVIADVAAVWMENDPEAAKAYLARRNY